MTTTRTAVPFTCSTSTATARWQASPPATTTQGGTLYPSIDGSFTYNPPTNFNGSDSFTYNLWDGAALSNTATVTLTVNAINDAPVAVDDSFTATQGVTLTATTPNGLVTNVSDIDTALGSLTFVLDTGPIHAQSFSLNADGSFTYQAVGTYAGPDSFTWHANDGSANSNVATMSITVDASGGGGWRWWWWRLPEGLLIYND